MLIAINKYHINFVNAYSHNPEKIWIFICFPIIFTMLFLRKSFGTITINTFL